ncbi:MAG: type II secretion system major pseudopilin GspG [Candidatus Glassbacteria bacterium]
MKTRGKGQEGFTLIEMIVVMIILAVIAGLVGPRLFKNVARAKKNAAKAQIQLLGIALDQYRLDNDMYPSTEQGLEALMKQPVTPPIPDNWDGPYLKKEIPLDPWGREYYYESPGTYDADGYDLYSLGRDGIEGGEDEDEDIVSWK